MDSPRWARITYSLVNKQISTNMITVALRLTPPLYQPRSSSPYDKHPEITSAFDINILTFHSADSPDGAIYLISWIEIGRSGKFKVNVTGAQLPQVTFLEGLTVANWLLRAQTHHEC